MFPTGRNQFRGKRPPPSEATRTMSLVSHKTKLGPRETPYPIRGRQDHVPCFPPAEISAVGNTQPHQKPPEPCPLFPTASNNRLLTSPGAPRPFSAPGDWFSLLRGARGTLTAPGNRFSLLPGAPNPFSAPGDWFSSLRGARGTLTAPGNRFSLLPRAPSPLFAPGDWFSSLRGARGTLTAPGNRFSLLPRAPSPFSAPGNVFSVLPGAPGPFSAPGSWILQPLKVQGIEIERRED